MEYTRIKKTQRLRFMFYFRVYSMMPWQVNLGERVQSYTSFSRSSKACFRFALRAEINYRLTVSFIPGCSNSMLVCYPIERTIVAKRFRAERIKLRRAAVTGGWWLLFRFGRHLT
jgi:hypothetical protein